MKIFENKNSSNRSGNVCGYCRNAGHNRANCPHAPEDWEYFSVHQIPISTSKVNSYWFKRPKYWGSWYEECKKTIELQERNAKKAKTKRATIRKCGFCGDTGHTRRNCPEMKKFVAQCYKANENWRRAAYEILVEEHGIDTGAAVQASERSNYWNNNNPATHIGLITSINWDSLNVMTAFKGCYDYGTKYGQVAAIRVLIDGKEHQLSLKSMLSDTSLREVISERNASDGYYYSNVALDKVIGRSEHPLKEEWVTSYKDAFDYLCKKLSLEQLKERGVYDHIQDWANRS
tara:strand:+ start:285 stop:1151 length:867 start_codon:yes stop_codon:yes gene_type:complete